ncbi:PREDICTED: ankyrin repeat domain-containing protein 60 [Nanorana parkeri]|uniref:ankyrin repeat domain-containing protein 60 n=1 Tax=Nanorana parkeri TaxID=125878 RepID=UPI0008542972|nr:PREDICTED: ankyrin repeat domain-containing protein 60 [Nanorana parkeri]
MAHRGKMKSGTITPRDSHFSIKVRLQETRERFSVPGCSHHMKMAELKEKLELVAGIPIHLQRLSYIDEGDMPDSSTFKFNAIIHGGTVCLSIWSREGWSDLVKAAAGGNLAELKCLGVTTGCSYNTENSLRFSVKQRDEWIAARASVALYIAAHRGYLDIISFLLKNGADVLAKTKLGNSPLHVASAMGKCDCVDELLANGAKTQDVNENGHTALGLAKLWGQKKVERHLFQFQWRERAAAVSVNTHLDPSELFAHQKFDSKLKTWRSGSYAKRYMANLVQYKEF